jgi:hypothetical protein
MMPPGSASARSIGVLTAAVGVMGVARPALVSRWAAGDSASPEAGFVRLLGARYLVQSAAELSIPTRAILRAACVVDGLHAASMIGAAIAFPAYRRAALVSAAIAGGSAIATTVSASRVTGNG